MPITLHANGTMEGINNSNFNTSLPSGHIITTTTNTLTGANNIASDADNPTASGLITTVTTQGTGSSFLVSSVGANPHCNTSASNSSVKFFL